MGIPGPVFRAETLSERERETKRTCIEKQILLLTYRERYNMELKLATHKGFLGINLRIYNREKECV